jgi:glycerol-3-phosphate acyltransferase PlsX
LRGVVVTVPAACDFLEKHADVNIALVGDPELIQQVLSKSSNAPMERIQIIPASEVVLMDDPIEVALRQ